jgi:hypothetical protein
VPEDPCEFLFVDESGDPGPGGTPHYIMACIQADMATLVAVQAHLVNFRYHHGIRGELKDWGGLLKDHPTQMTRSLLRFLLELTGPQGLRASANWLHKDSYIANGGPHLGTGSPTHWFQNYQLRRLLGRHAARNGWGDNVDLVLDRWPMTPSQDRNLRGYIQQKCDLDPPPHHITVTDSSYVPLIDLVDFYSRLVKVTLEDGIDAQYVDFANSLMSVKEIPGGLY